MMSIINSPCLRLVAFAATAALLSGCGPSRMKTVEVKGAVSVDGKPAPKGILSLSPTDPKTGIPNATGQIDGSGNVALSSYPGKSGVVPGSYQVYLPGDPMAIGKTPPVKPITVTIPETGGEVAFKFDSLKNSRPGALPSAQPEASAKIKLPGLRP